MSTVSKIFLLAGLLLAGGGWLLAAELENAAENRLQYTSRITYVNTQTNLTLSTVSEIVSSGQKVRVTTRAGQKTLGTISDGQNIFLLDYKTKLAYRQKIAPSSKPGPLNPDSKTKNKTMTKIGPAVFDGKNCQKYLLEDPGRQVRETIWFWEDKNFPLKVETENGPEKMTIINTHISFNPPEKPGQFDLPADFKIVADGPDEKD